jgi:hypothetical protein
MDYSRLAFIYLLYFCLMCVFVSVCLSQCLRCCLIKEITQLLLSGCSSVRPTFICNKYKRQEVRSRRERSWKKCVLHIEVVTRTLFSSCPYIFVVGVYCRTSAIGDKLRLNVLFLMLRQTLLTPRRNIPEGSNLHIRRRENLKSHITHTR